MKKIAEVALDKVTFHVDLPYSYEIPSYLKDDFFLGQRVLVPFGIGNTKRQGVITKISDEKPSTKYKLKSILAVIDKEPVISKEMYQLAVWIKEQTFCTFYEAFSLMIPAGMNMKFRVFYRLEEDYQNTSFDEKEIEIIETFKKLGNNIEDQELFKVLNIKKESNSLKKLIKMNIIVKKHDIIRTIQDDSILMVELNKDFNDEVKVTKKQEEVIDVLKKDGTQALKDLIYKAGVTRVVVDNLKKKGVLEFYEEESFRNPYTFKGKPEKLDIILTDEQKEAYNGLLALLKKDVPEAGLLFGITGSGKTQVYLKLIEQTLKEGKQVIFLVPEISLTSQTIRILQKYFGSEIAVLHSGLSLGERLDEYKRLQQGYANIAVGTRSAVFAPLNNIGLIVIDEEQEYTYKSESTPRYHTRDVAKFRCNYNKALLVLGSATPSLESFYNAKNNNYSYFSLKNRYGEAILPQVYLVDMNEERSKDEVSVLSLELIEEINYNLDKNEQVILLLNRRGFNTVVACSNCGEKVTCPHCSIAMTYHKKNNKLLCHYCGHIKDFPKKCDSCGSSKLNALGLGTQRVEQTIEETFKNSRVLRMDQDSTLAKHSHEEKLMKFRNKEFDIMIGTQMVAKGLDFENVTLVGVLNADQSLYSTDFRAYERTFSLLTQVVGRSGRGDKEGRAFVQTFTPFNEILNYAATQNYEEFYNQEIETRKAMLYPPFSNFCVVGFAGNLQKNTWTASKKFSELLILGMEDKKNIPLRVLGPMPAYIEKIAGKYRYKIIIKCVNNNETRNFFKKVIIQYYKSEEARGVTSFIDMNYYGNI